MKNIMKYMGFGVGALGMDLSYGLFFTFLNFYMTDKLYLSPLFLMFFTLAARVWDGFNDPIMGAIVDGTKSRFGKYRGWLILGAALNGIALALLYTNPGFALNNGKPGIDRKSTRLNSSH